MDKRKKFKAALALAGITREEFARRHGVTPTMIFYVLRDHRHSKRISKAIDHFIEEQFVKAGLQHEKAA